MTSLNRIVAVAMVHGERTALGELEDCAATPELAGHHRVHSVRGHLLERLGETAAAVEQYRLAARATLSVPEQRYLMTRVRALTG
jgi:predicted RNA polymerase sigma factor